MVRASAIDVDPKSICTSMEEAFNYCFSVDVDPKFCRNINRIFFGKYNNRMVEMLEHAAIFAKKKGLASMNEYSINESDNDSKSDSDASRSSDDTRATNFSPKGTIGNRSKISQTIFQHRRSWKNLWNIYERVIPSLIIYLS